MPKLQINDDGTVTFPLRKRDPITLDEPCMEDLAWLSVEAGKLDDALPELPTVDDAKDADQVAAFVEASQARTRVIYDEELPYGKLVIEAIKRITDGEETVDARQLYGWAMSPSVIRALLEHWRAPLPGPASLPNQ